MSDRQSMTDIALDRFWDDLVLGRVSDPAADPTLDPMLADAVRRLQPLAATPAGDPAFGSRLWDELMAEHGERGNVAETVAPPATPRALARPAQSGRRWAPPAKSLFRFVSAAMLAAVLVLLIVETLGPGGQHGGVILPTGTAIPAVATPAPATPADGVNVGPVYQVTFSGGSLPPNDIFLEIGVLRYAPGAIAYDYGDLDTGFGLMAVTGGTLGQTNDRPVLVQRSGSGTVESVPAGNEAVLSNGDVLVEPDFNAKGPRRTIGAEDAVMVVTFVRGPRKPVAGLATPVGDTFVDNDFVVTLSGSGDRSLAGLDGGPVTLVVRRVSVAPGAMVPLAPDHGYTVRFVITGAATWSIVGSGATPGAPHKTFKNGVIPYTPLASGESMLIQNTSQAPLVYYEVTVEPAAPDATPVAP